MLTKKLSILSILFLVLLSLLPLVYATPIFTDGFETGNGYTPWTGQNLDAGNTLEVSSTQAHSGINSSHSITSYTYGEGDCMSAEYKTFTAATSTYLRFYVYVHALSVGINHHFFFAQLDDEYFELAAIGVVNRTGKGAILYIQYRDSGGGQEVDSATQLPTLDTWHCYEIMRTKNATAGEIRVWLDGTEITDLHKTSLNTDGYTIDRVRAGPWGSDTGTGDSIEQYIDDVIVDSAYIGPIISGLNLTFELNNTIIVSENHVFNKELAFLQFNTIQPSDVVSMNKAIGGILIEFLSTNSLYPSANLLFNKELAFWKIENIFPSATSTMSKALKITLYELFDFVKLHTSNIMLPTWLAMTIDVAVAIAVLALVLSITGISIVFLRRRRDQ